MSKTAPRTIYLVPARAVGRIQNPVTQVPRPVLPRGGHVAQPQPLVGTRQCLKRPAPSPPVSDPIEQLLGEHTGPCPPRKRERLNHLTAEEKLNRRKMKNRVAAQTARDRKKVRSQRLEDVVRQLLEENTLLREENKRLREQQHQFQKMEPQQEQRKEMAFESAAFISGPQPRVQVSSLLLLSSALLLVQSSSFRSTSSIASSKISRATSTSTNSPASSLMEKTRSSKRPLFGRSLNRRRLWSRVS